MWPFLKKLFGLPSPSDVSATDADRIPGLDWQSLIWVIPDVVAGSSSTIVLASQAMLDIPLPYWYALPAGITGDLENMVLGGGADCSGLILTLAVYAGLCTAEWANGHRSTYVLIPALTLITASDWGLIRIGDVACYEGHVAMVVGFDDDGVPLCISQSGGHDYTHGDDPNACSKLVRCNYREDFKDIRRFP
jgi:hypothetical protein